MPQLVTISLFECLLCTTRFSLNDVKEGQYFPTTKVCKSCYDAAQLTPYSQWCFGKPDKVKDGKVIRYGYNPEASSCKHECPDREICKMYVQRKEAR